MKFMAHITVPSYDGGIDDVLIGISRDSDTGDVLVWAEGPRTSVCTAKAVEGKDADYGPALELGEWQGLYEFCAAINRYKDLGGEGATPADLKFSIEQALKAAPPESYLAAKSWIDALGAILMDQCRAWKELNPNRRIIDGQPQDKEALRSLATRVFREWERHGWYKRSAKEYAHALNQHIETWGKGPPQGEIEFNLWLEIAENELMPEGDNNDRG